MFTTINIFQKKRMLLAFSILVFIAIAIITAGSSMAAGNKTGRIKEGGSIVVSITNEPDFLDPYLATAAGTREILFNIFEGLVKPDEEGNLVPAIAGSYQISKDALKYTFKLRQGVEFHNGNPVTAQDVKYSIDKASGKDNGKPYQPALANIKSVAIKDAATVEVYLSKADTDFLASLTVAIVPKSYNNQNKKPIGTGPFKFGNYIPQQQLVLTKNPVYWQKGLPHLDRVTFKLSADEDAAFLGLKAGTIDMEPYTTSDKAQQLTGDYNVLKGNYNLVQLLALNNARKPFNDIRVRQALSYAIDTQKIINTVTYGEGTRIGSAVFPGFKKYYQPGLENTYKTDIAKAKSLLKQAGYADGFETTITVPSNYKTHVDTAQVIVEQLKAIGVKASIKQVEWGVWLDQVYFNRQYDSTVIALDAAVLSARSLLGRYLSTEATNFINYKDPRYDQILKQAIHETDDAKQVKYYKQLQTILTQDAASVFIQDPPRIVLLKKNLAGYKFYPLYVQDLATIYYTK
jgi:peptide/nickel transport system substrate-binding protein